MGPDADQGYQEQTGFLFYITFIPHRYTTQQVLRKMHGSAETFRPFMSCRPSNEEPTDQGNYPTTDSQNTP